MGDKSNKPIIFFGVILSALMIIIVILGFNSGINKESSYITKSKDIEKVIKSAGGSLLTNIEVFDVYTGTNVADDKKSIAYSLTFADNKKTLTDEEVNGLMEKVMNKWIKRFEEILSIPRLDHLT